MSVLYLSVLVWLDTRTSSTVDKLIAKTPQKDKDHLRVTHNSNF